MNPEVPEVFREARTGGRYAVRMPVPGEAVGDARVIEIIGKREGRGDTLWSVRCGCGKLQHRTTGQINLALRRGFSLSCPECWLELIRGKSAEAKAARAHARMLRVLDGGPVWSDSETIALANEVRAALEEEFGELPDEESEWKPDDFVTAAGWPYSAHRRVRDLEAEQERRLYNKAAHANEARALAVERESLKTARDKEKEVEGAQRIEERAGYARYREREAWLAIMRGEDVVSPTKRPRGSEQMTVSGDVITVGRAALCLLGWFISGGSTVNKSEAKALEELAEKNLVAGETVTPRGRAVHEAWRVMHRPPPPPEPPPEPEPQTLELAPEPVDMLKRARELAAMSEPTRPLLPELGPYEKVVLRFAYAAETEGVRRKAMPTPEVLAAVKTLSLKGLLGSHMGGLHKLTSEGHRVAALLGEV